MTGIRERKGSVSIVGLGASRDDFLAARLVYGDETDPMWDKVWAINAMGGAIVCDRVIHMDPIHVVVEMPRWKRLMDYLKAKDIEVITSYAHPDYPNAKEYPIKEVVDMTGYSYFNTSVAYAIALAIYEGYKQIWLYGLDFSYPDKNMAESGRGCAEFWISYGMRMGVNIGIGARSTLLDIHAAGALYGYHKDKTRDVGPDNPCLSLPQLLAMRDGAAVPEVPPAEVATAEIVQLHADVTDVTEEPVAAMAEAG